MKTGETEAIYILKYIFLIIVSAIMAIPVIGCLAIRWWEFVSKLFGVVK